MPGHGTENEVIRYEVAAVGILNEAMSGHLTGDQANQRLRQLVRDILGVRGSASNPFKYSPDRRNALNGSSKVPLTHVR